MEGKINITLQGSNDILLEVNLRNDDGDKDIVLISYHVVLRLNYIEIGHITGFHFNKSILPLHKLENVLTVKFYIPPTTFDLIEKERKRLGGVHSGGTEIELLYHEENSQDIKNTSVSLGDYRILESHWSVNTYYSKKYEDIVKELIIHTKSILENIHIDILHYAFKHRHFTANNSFTIDLMADKSKYNKKELEMALKYLSEYGYIVQVTGESNNKIYEYYISSEKLEEIKKIIKWKRYKDIVIDFLKKHIIIILGAILAVIIFISDIIGIINRLF